MRLSGTKLQFTRAYHPQSDGQTEVRNRGLEQYLRAFTADRPSKWANFLPWAELALNCFHHAALGTSPFRALYGREPPLLVAAPPSAKTPPKAADLIRQRGELLVELRRNLERACVSMAATANRHRRHVEFDVGDLVWLKLQPYRQHSVAKPLSSKLSKRFYGPFEILEQVGPVAYRLRLPEGSRIHNVFHVTLLKEFVAGEREQAGVPLPEKFLGSRPIALPAAVLETKVMWREGKPTKHVLIRWSDGLGTTTWEPADSLMEKFPDLFLGDKESSNGGRGGRVVRNTPAVPTNTASTATVKDSMDMEREFIEEEEMIPDTSNHEESRDKSCAVTARELRPRNRLKQPMKYRDFVSK